MLVRWCSHLDKNSYEYYMSLLILFIFSEEQSQENLYYVRVPAISNEECKTNYSIPPEYITDAMVCAAYPEGGKY